MRAIFIYIISLFLTGCDGSVDTDSDTGFTYGQDARVVVDVGWRPVVMEGR